ncbi:MAG: hypothetical protein ACI4BI_03405 [Anaerotardibacter sp.]
MSDQTVWTCASCGANNSSKFCTSCGSPRPVEAAAAVAPVVAPVQEPVSQPVVNQVQADPQPENQPTTDTPQSYVSTGIPNDTPQPGTYQAPISTQPIQNAQGGAGDPGYVPGNQGFNTQTTNPRGLYGERSLGLQNWKTNVPMSILGFVAVLAVSGIASNILPFLPLAIFAIAFSAVCIVYAAVMYVSYFDETPKLDNVEAINFLNLFFGSIIFGCIWNSNLTKGKKGISWIVFIVFQALNILSVMGSIGYYFS